MLGPSEEHPGGLLLSQPALQLLTNLVNIAALVGLVVMMAAPFLRFRRASYQQRQQLKWVAYITLLSMLSAFTGIGLSLDPPIHEWGRCFLTQAGCRGVPAVAVVTAGRRMWLVRAACWWLRGRVIPSPP
jgi:NhaP-type Na+/H+ or K+/H+ antiporter